ncbi:hypothetical protein ACFW93_11495 [Streptomyces canus]
MTREQDEDAGHRALKPVHPPQPLTRTDVPPAPPLNTSHGKAVQHYDP